MQQNLLDRRSPWRRVLGAIFRVAGLRREPGSRGALRPTPLFFGWVAAGFLFLGGSTFAFFYTSRPSFCSTCHNIRPYYASWNRSAHRDVACLTCHTAPGTVNYLKRKCLAISEVVQYVTNTYEPRPRSRIADASCLREGCHAADGLSRELAFTVDRAGKTAMEIRFDHAKHLKKTGDKQLQCVSCHLQVTQDVHFQVRAGVCFLCHLHGSTLEGSAIPRLAGRDKPCTACHDAPVGAIRLATGTYNHAEFVGVGADCRSCHQDSVRGGGEVHVENCLHCHGEPDKLLARTDPVRLHEAHVAAHEAECFDCHYPIEHGLPYAHTTHLAQCSSCHQTSHEPAALVYEGRGGRGVEELPSPMYRAHVDCQGCHVDARVGDVPAGKKPTEVACRACHASRYDGKLAEWRRTTDALLAETEALLAEADRTSLGLAGAEFEAARAILDDARYNVALVKKGAAVHNINYATALLNLAKATAERLIRPSERL